jgi:hypothetical protein
MKKRTTSSRLRAMTLLLVLAAVCAACEGGVGVGLGYSYPGRIYGPVGGGSWGGGPAW